jgi:hypothetical protein
MRTLLVVAMVLCACGGKAKDSGDASRTLPPEHEPRQTKSGVPGLDETVADCRTSNIGDIGSLGDVLGPTCAGQMLPIALQNFELGATRGFLVAAQWAGALSLMCACADKRCSEENELAAVSAMERAVAEQSRSEREGANHLISSLANHSCLRADVAVRLFKLGYACAFLTGLNSQAVKDERLRLFQRLEGGDRAKAMERALACGAK